MENEFKKITSAIPTEKDFIDVLIALSEHQKPPLTATFDSTLELREFYLNKVSSAMRSFVSMFDKVFHDYPSPSQIAHPYGCILHHRHSLSDYGFARTGLMTVCAIMHSIGEKYVRLFYDEEDCDSLDSDPLDCDTIEKCKSLKRSGLACLLTVARRCIPNLAFLDQVRHYMVNAEDDYAAGTLEFKRDLKGYQVPQLISSADFSELVDPETLTYLEELDRGHNRGSKGGDLKLVRKSNL